MNSNIVITIRRKKSMSRHIVLEEVKNPVYKSMFNFCVDNLIFTGKFK